MIKNSTLLTVLLSSTLGFTQNEFTFKFFDAMQSQDNILFSPTSIKTAFAMAYEGADSSTKTEFENVFNFKADNADFLNEIKQLKQVAEISNSVWIQEKFDILESYVKTLKKKFDSAPYQTDFKGDPEGSADKINKWIEKSTNGMIKKMLTADAVTEFKLALVNAVYFKQNWKAPFEERLTKKDKFTNANKSNTEVDMMHSLSYFKALDGKHEKVIELPYENNKTSMVIILPHKMKNYELSDAIYTDLIAHLVYQKVNLDLPKFTFETPTFELKPFLIEMGLKRAFSGDADFSGIRKEKDLIIGTALHKAKIIVNEEGTEAAAATVIGIRTTSTSSRPDPILKMTVDKPFYYFIKDNETKSILFMGRMNEIK